MPCYRPIRAWYSSEVNKETGNRSLVFKRPNHHFGEVEVPCGSCGGCNEDRARTWATRIMHEASQYDTNCFITLTYNDSNYPDKGSLVYEDFRDFMKRLRKIVSPLASVSCGYNFKGNLTLTKSFMPGPRFYHCGEYGENFSRPHYHACIFGYDFPDKVLYSKSKGYYRSPTLEKLWTKGYSNIGNLTFESAAYVARYCTKKINGDLAPGHYQGRKPEYSTMSRRPGIGHSWMTKYSSEVLRDGFIVGSGGNHLPIPRYYFDKYSLTFPDRVISLKHEMRIHSKLLNDGDPSRRVRRAEVHQLRSKERRRGYERVTSRM